MAEPYEANLLWSSLSLKTKLLIIQEYVPNYRRDFFAKLKQMSGPLGFEIKVAAGRPGHLLAARGDSTFDSIDFQIRQKEIRFLGRRLTFRYIPTNILSFDLLIVEHARRNLDIFLLLIARRVGLIRTKIALWGHGRDYVKSTSKIEKFLLLWLAKNCDHYFVYTKSGSDFLRAQGLASERITVVQNSLGLVQRNRDDAKFSKPPRLAFVGALEEDKGALELSPIIRTILRAIPTAQFDIIGEGSIKDALKKEFSNENSVVLHGYLSGASKLEVLSKAWVILQPRRIGLSAIDALFSGTPIVTRTAQLHAPEVEYLELGKSLFVLRSEIDQFCVDLFDLFQDKKLLNSAHIWCLEESKKFTLDAMVENYIKGIQGFREV